MQLIASTLFQDAAPVASPIIERSFAEKVDEAIAAIKSLILASKRLIVASSFGKDSSVTLAIALKAKNVEIGAIHPPRIEQGKQHEGAARIQRR